VLRVPWGGRPGAPPRLSSALVRRDPVLLLLAAVITACAVGGGLDVGPLLAQVLANWLLLTGLHVGLAVSAARVASVPGVTAGTRRTWVALSVAASIFLIGDLVQFGLLARGPFDRDAALGGVVQSWLVIAGVAQLVVVLCTLPSGIVDVRARLRYWLDLGVVLLAAATFVLGPLGQPDAGNVLDGVFGAVLFVGGVYVVVRLLLSARPPFTAAAGLTIALAATLQAVANAIPSLTHDAHLTWNMTLSVIANATLTAAGRIQLQQMRAGGPVMPGRRRRP
jgi:diguanylate cyclase